MLQRIALSLGTIALVAGIGIASTGAFFNDTETSTGNTFAAGDIDLKVDNESFAVDYNVPGVQAPTGAFAFNPATSWSLTDLVAGTQHFFQFADLKPGDMGEDTISLHLGSNTGYLCAAARLTANSDNTCTEPETTDEAGQCGTGDALTNGDLASQLNFVFWKDDGDNVYETGEAAPFLAGPLSGLGAQGKIALADTSGNAPFGTSVPGNSTIYIGKAWCFGTLAPTPVTQDNLGNTDVSGPGTGTNGPNVRTTGWSCNGAGSIDNKAQTDSVTGDMQFYAVQARNNPTFTCAANYTPTW